MKLSDNAAKVDEEIAASNAHGSPDFPRTEYEKARERFETRVGGILVDLSAFMISCEASRTSGSSPLSVVDELVPRSEDTNTVQTMLCPHVM